jgi:plasmid stabilization system protein ParE
LPGAQAALIEVVWTASALADLGEIRAYIGQFNPRAAREVAASLKGLDDSLATFPNRGRQVPGTTMRELISKYPYIIRYRIAVGRVASCVSVMAHDGRQIRSRRLGSSTVMEPIHG